MKPKQITKEMFEKIFNEAMLIDKVYQYQYDEHTGASREQIIPIKPHIVIRDFEIKEYPQCDTEFFAGQMEEAWIYFQSLGNYCRLIGGNGSIYADFYSEVSRRLN